ncbi:MAG: putative transporter, permease protein [Chlamydiales bacterium]|jgi:lipoprotein-releasing system permease protein|nr:putative transporter, permease protein [Chlamydiales bacterium]
MYEIAVALRYLLPKWRQLSVSLISLVSVFVISLVVWLILVFFSVTEGMERGWTEKLIALTAPIRVTPTANYYQSYYYLIDQYSEKSDYTLKTIGEKRTEGISQDPYDSALDGELPDYFPTPCLNPDGSLKDLVNLAFHAIQEETQAQAGDYEVAVANLRLHLQRSSLQDSSKDGSILSQTSYLSSLDLENPSLKKTWLPPRKEDIDHVLQRLSSLFSKSPEPYIQPLTDFLAQAEIKAFKTPPFGLKMAQQALEGPFQLQAIGCLQKGRPHKIYIPKDTKEIQSALRYLQAIGIESHPIEIEKKPGELAISTPSKANWQQAELHLAEGISLIAGPPSEWQDPRRIAVKALIQGQKIQSSTPLSELVSDSFSAKEGLTEFLLKQQSPLFGHSLLLPKSFQESGVLLGDKGYIHYFAPTTSGMQEQRLAVFVAGFYDPGIIPIGGKMVLVDKKVTALIRNSQQFEDALISNGINVRTPSLSDCERIAERLKKRFQELGLSPYWHIETYREYEFTKPLFQQLQSEKNVFMLISMIIIVVACSNIVSMLIILVRDKRLEIGILRSMGATSLSIALIFGSLGAILGLMSSLIGTGLALVTLRYFDQLLKMLSYWQGHAVFNEHFYGNIAYQEMSWKALSFVLAATICISLIAAICPALKAARLKPGAILKPE